jgi:hypothetical protein
LRPDRGTFVSVVNDIARLFIQRPDVKAVQTSNGIYMPDRSKFTRQDLEDHVAGKKSYGHYMINPDGNCKLFAYDIDLAKSWLFISPQSGGTTKPPEETWTPDGVLPLSPRDVFADTSHPARPGLITELRAVAEGLAARVQRVLEIPVAISFSGSKGMHVYGFTGSAPAFAVRDAAIEVLKSYDVFEPVRGDNFYRHTNEPQWGFPNVEVEIFPKQGSLEGKDLGNLMRLPLGRNLKGGEAFFVDPNAPAGQLVALDPARALAGGDLWQN